MAWLLGMCIFSFHCMSEKLIPNLGFSSCIFFFFSCDVPSPCLVFSSFEFLGVTVLKISFTRVIFHVKSLLKVTVAFK